MIAESIGTGVPIEVSLCIGLGAQLRRRQEIACEWDARDGSVENRNEEHVTRIKM